MRPWECPACDKIENLCDICLAQAMGWLGGTAACRGFRWAERVLKRAPGKEWPAYDASERVRMLAIKQILDLTRDKRLREALARDCADAARRRYGQG